ncbi:hypothetical protein GCM10022630_21490 [Thermobifida alba]
MVRGPGPGKEQPRPAGRGNRRECGGFVPRAIKAAEKGSGDKIAGASPGQGVSGRPSQVRWK